MGFTTVTPATAKRTAELPDRGLGENSQGRAGALLPGQRSTGSTVLSMQVSAHLLFK